LSTYRTLSALVESRVFICAKLHFQAPLPHANQIAAVAAEPGFVSIISFHDVRAQLRDKLEMNFLVLVTKFEIDKCAPATSNSAPAMNFSNVPVEMSQKHLNPLVLLL
jgi:hypothetical protein